MFLRTGAPGWAPRCRHDTELCHSLGSLRAGVAWLVPLCGLSVARCLAQSRPSVRRIPEFLRNSPFLWVVLPPS